MVSNKNNDKVKYNILFVPNTEEASVKKIGVRQEFVIAFFAAIVFLVVAALAYGFILTDKLELAMQTIANLNSQIGTLTQENSNLATKNKELEDKVSILSDTVNEKIQKEDEIASTYIPSGFPLEGTVTYIEGETRLNGKAIAYFQGTTGAKVTSTGNGVVSSVSGDAESGYAILIDHENGYFSMYRNSSEPRVKTGDNVTNTTVLYELEEGKEKLGYQIIKDEIYINPLDVMEIHG